MNVSFSPVWSSEQIFPTWWVGIPFICCCVEHHGVSDLVYVAFWERSSSLYGMDICVAIYILRCYFFVIYSVVLIMFFFFSFIIIISLLVTLSHQRWLVVIHWRLSDSKSLQVSWTFLSILSDLKKCHGLCGFDPLLISKSSGLILDLRNLLLFTH